MILKLDTCPCCGGDARLHHYTGDVGFIKCESCGLQTAYLKIDEAARRWNKRKENDNENDRKRRA